MPMTSPISLSSNFSVYRIEENQNMPKLGPTLETYTFTVDEKDAQKFMAKLEKKKSDSFDLFVLSTLVVIFSNLATGTSFPARAVNVIVSGLFGSVIIGSGYQHVKALTTLDKVKMVFGNRDQQADVFASLAKELPPGFVTIQKEPYTAERIQ